MKLFSALILSGLVLAASAQASSGLVIHAAEVGIGKFHRYDNGVHVYGNENVWKAFIAPAGTIQSPLVVHNADDSYAIFFSTLEELLSSAITLSTQTGQKISVLNINAHGLPGAMWFPKDAAEMQGAGCKDWLKAANAPDQANYDQYYSPVSKTDIMGIRQFSNFPDSPLFKQPCTVGLEAWKEKVAKFAAIKTAFTADAQLHLLSCVVGLGNRGEAYTKGLAALLFTGDQALVRTSLNFGLGDWSMPEGMGFWDYLNDAQLEHDNQGYPVNRRDRDMMQKGSRAWSEKESRELSVQLIELLSSARSGDLALSPALERFALSLK
jgi:hypothetical protein